MFDEDKSEKPPWKLRKYTTFSDEQRAGRWGSMLPKMVTLHSGKSEIPNLGESTVRFFKKRYLDELRVSPVTAITPRKRGRPLTLGETDEEVRSFSEL